MRTAIWVGVAGFFGSIARYAVSGAVSRVNESFPWGTSSSTPRGRSSWDSSWPHSLTASSFILTCASR